MNRLHQLFETHPGLDLPQGAIDGMGGQVVQWPVVCDGQASWGGLGAWASIQEEGLEDIGSQGMAMICDWELGILDTSQVGGHSGDLLLQVPTWVAVAVEKMDDGCLGVDQWELEWQSWKACWTEFPTGQNKGQQLQMNQCGIGLGFLVGMCSQTF